MPLLNGKRLHISVEANEWQHPADSRKWVTYLFLLLYVGEMMLGALWAQHVQSFFLSFDSSMLYDLLLKDWDMNCISGIGKRHDFLNSQEDYYPARYFLIKDKIKPQWTSPSSGHEMPVNQPGRKKNSLGKEICPETLENNLMPA